MNNLEGQNQNLSLNYNISEPIVKNILEKIISLTITQVDKNKIEREIPDFCFKDIKQTLELAIFVDFVNYDKDDMKHKNTLLDFNSKSDKKLKIPNNSDIDLSHNTNSYQKILKRKSKSEKLKKYKLTKYFDPNISFENSTYLGVFCSQKKKAQKKKKENKDPTEYKLDELVIRDDSYNYINKDSKTNKDVVENNDFKKKDEPFVINSHEEIENIKRTETHDLDYNPVYNSLKNNNNKNKILYDSIIDSENNWSLITQPSAPPIDRDASTKIKYDPPSFKLNKMNSLLNKDLIKEEEENVKNKKDKNQIKKTTSKNILRLKIPKIDEKPVKKKKYPQLIEFPSEDIDPKILGKETESEELKKLRNDLENEIALKKLEAEKKLKKEQEEIALEKAREEKRKELAHKNVTTDIKGELVYIKSLNVNDFIHEFTKGRSNFKEIRTIEDELKSRMRGKRKSIIIEKNPDAFIDKEELEKTQKKKRNRNLYSSLKRANDEKKEKEKEKDKEKDKNQGGRASVDKNKPPLIGAGSNFDLMLPECGVNLIEEKKTKSGGKDYFTKYNKYSLQFFEETFNKTISSNFYQNSILNNGTNAKNKKNIKEQLMESIREKASDKKIINHDLNTIMPSESNDKLLVKTKNLKKALNELDLITEGDEKLIFDKKNRNKNILKRKKIMMNFRKHSKKDYKEIDKFAKTLMGGENWGNNIYKTINNLKQSFKQPTKPILDELKREVPATLLNHLPRKRLPPIINKLKDNKMGYTITEGFFNKNKKLKLRSVPKDESKKIQIEEEDNSVESKNSEEKNDELDYNTTSNFYKNTIS